MTTPLQGLAVLDLSRLLPGPWCSMLLADLGAEVIKVEEPKLGDYTRWRSPRIGGQATDFLMLNRNKRSLTLNLKSRQGKEIFFQLVERADIVLESFRPGVTERLGVNYEAVNAVNPRVIYCSISGYGQDGPYQDFAGHDINYMAYTGVLDMTGAQAGPPTLMGVQVADIACGGMMAAVGILAAVIARERTGKGQFVDVSMFDGLLAMLNYQVGRYFATGVDPARGGGRLTGGVPGYGIYETKDGRYVAIGALERKFWARLCHLLDLGDLADTPDPKGDKAEEARLALQAKFLEKTQADWVSILQRADVCFSPVNTLSQAVQDPQTSHREMIVHVDHPTTGCIPQLGVPIKFSQTPGRIRRPPPLFGEHTGQILQELGYSKSEINTLGETGVI